MSLWVVNIDGESPFGVDGGPENRMTMRTDLDEVCKLDDRDDANSVVLEKLIRSGKPLP